MNHVLKTVVLSGAAAMFAMMFGCANLSPSGDPGAEQAASSELSASPLSGNVCDQFCQSQGGPHYLVAFASSEAACNQKGGDWYTEDQGYPGPPPGCCCKCAAPGFCL